MLWCYTCGEKDKSYTQSQLKKEDKARCNDCIESENTKKFEPYDYLHQHKISDKNNIHKQLMDAISAMNLDKVIVLLSMGANPNYIKQETFYCPVKHKHLLSYNADGSEKTDFEEEQPTTPLKLCVFCFSDPSSNKSVIIEIAKQLIKFGASIDEGKEYYLLRYSAAATPAEGLWYTFYKLLCNQ